MTHGFYRTLVFALLAGVGFTSPAHATIIQWDLENVAAIANPSETVTGYFDVDSISQNVTFVDFSLSGFNAGNFSFQLPSSSGGARLITSGRTLDASTLDNGTYLGIDLDSGINLSQPSVSPVSLLSGNGIDTAVLVGGEFEYLQGSLTTNVSAVSLPPALPMFATALIGFAGFAWRRRREKLA
jgi:hypothetical protein